MSGEGGNGPVSGDQFDEALKSLLDGNAGQPRFREMSAADRAKQADKARKQAERNRAKHARRRSGRRRHLGRGARILVTTVVLAVIGGGGLYAVSHFKPLRGHLPQAGITKTPVPAASAAPLPANVFAGTRADDWADGAAGIVLPAAHAVGPYSAAQVASAYATTERLLIAGNLDRSVLFGAKPTVFADLLAAPQRTQFLAGLNATGVSKDGSPRNTHSWIAVFAPGSAELIGDVIKVHGSLSAKVAHVSGMTVLAVVVNYLFAYPVARPGTPADWMRIVDHETGSIDFGNWQGPSGPFAPESLTQTANAGAYCAFQDGYIHPDYPAPHIPDTHATGPVVDPYSTALPPGQHEATCFQTNGT
jgi:hypothetical protein